MMKQAFMGAWGQCLVLLRESMPDDEEKSVAILTDLWKQVYDYWAQFEVKKN